MYVCGKFEVRNLLSGFFVMISFPCTWRHAAMRWHLECCLTASQVLETTSGFSDLFLRNIQKTGNYGTFSYLTVHLSSSPHLVAL